MFENVKICLIIVTSFEPMAWKIVASKHQSLDNLLIKIFG